MSSESKSIEVELDHFHHQPFQTLSGKVRAVAPVSARSMELRVFWFTRGRGDEEAKIVHRIELSPDQPIQDFSWKLPAAPYSFAGQLITLAWAVEVVDEKESPLDLVPFLLSPTGEEVQLESVPDNSLKGRLERKLTKKFEKRNRR